MGAVGSFCKKVWSGIKCVAHAVWTGVKTVAKVVVKAVGYIGGILVAAASTVLLVAASVITGVLKKCALTILFVGLLLLSIVFLSSEIIFGRDNDNHKKEEETVNRTQINQNLGNKPNYEDEPKKKNYNLMKEFLDSVKSFNDNVLKKNLKDQKEFTFSFKMGENEEIIAKKLKDEQLNDYSNVSNVLVSRCYFDPLEFENNNEIKKGIKIELENEIEDVEKGKKILEGIKNALNIITNYNFDFFEHNNDNDKTEKKNLDQISNIGTILLKPGKL